MFSRLDKTIFGQNNYYCSSAKSFKTESFSEKSKSCYPVKNLHILN